jgi:hypothetical protein
MAVDRCLVRRPKRRDGVCNRVVKTTVQRAKFVGGDGLMIDHGPISGLNPQRLTQRR